MFQRLKVRAKMKKFLSGKWVNLCNLGVGNGFLNMVSKAQATKEKKR